MARLQTKTFGDKALRKRIKKQKIGSITKTLHKRLSVLWRNAADAYIRAAITRVLVETGMSAASFFPLSRAIKRRGSTKAISQHINSAPGKIDSRKGILTFPSGKIVPGIRSVASGNAVGQDAHRFDLGTPKKPIFRFQFSTVVVQLAIHEPNQNALDFGRAAFNDIIQRDFIPLMSVSLRDFLSLRPRTRRIFTAGEGN